VPQKYINDDGIGHEIARMVAAEGLLGYATAEVPYILITTINTPGATALDPYMSCPSIRADQIEHLTVSGISLKEHPAARDFWSQFR